MMNSSCLVQAKSSLKKKVPPWPKDVSWISAGFFTQSGWIFWLLYHVLHVTNQILAQKKFFGHSLSQIFLKRQKKRQIVSKQVKNRSKQVKKFCLQVVHLQTPFFSAPQHLLLFFSHPSNIFCQNGKKIQISLHLADFQKNSSKSGKKKLSNPKNVAHGQFQDVSTPFNMKS